VYSFSLRMFLSACVCICETIAVWRCAVFSKTSKTNLTPTLSRSLSLSPQPMCASISSNLESMLDRFSQQCVESFKNLWIEKEKLYKQTCTIEAAHRARRMLLAKAAQVCACVCACACACACACECVWECGLRILICTNSSAIPPRTLHSIL